MTFRDDHDAALARAEALENELEAERERTAAQAKQLEAERAERRRLEALVDAKRVEPSRSTRRDKDSGDPMFHTGEPVLMLMSAAIAGLFLLVVALARGCG